MEHDIIYLKKSNYFKNKKYPDFKDSHSLTLNISKMAGDTAIVTMEGE